MSAGLLAFLAAAAWVAWCRHQHRQARILAVREQCADDALWQAHAAMWGYEQQAWVLAGRPMHEVAK